MTAGTSFLPRFHRHDGVRDPALAGVVAVVLCATVNVAAEPGSRPVDVLAYLVGLGVGLALLARRWRPVAVLVGSAALVTAYHVLDYPAIGMAFPLAVALYSAARYGSAAAAANTSAALLVGAVLWWIAVEDAPWLVIVNDVVREGTLMAVVVLLGDMVRSRRALTESTTALLRSTEAERELETQHRVAEERLQIARELHDITAHTVTVISVQAEVAAEVLDEDVGAARDAIDAVRTAGHQAACELQTALDLLRRGAGDAPRSPAPGLGRLDELLDTVRRSGLTVDAAVTGGPRSLSAAVDLTAYRLVQESLTMCCAMPAILWRGWPCTTPPMPCA